MKRCMNDQNTKTSAKLRRKVCKKVFNRAITSLSSLKTMVIKIS